MPSNMLIFCDSFGHPQKNIKIDYYIVAAQDITPIELLWEWTVERSQKVGGIDNLLIACHGRYEGNHTIAERGGWGIRLGTGLDQKNVIGTNKLDGFVKNIYLYVCGGGREPNPALLAPGTNYSDFAHNRWTCRQMAYFSRCNVYASQGIESADTNAWNWDFERRFDFGKWEGKVEKFTPHWEVIDVTSRMTSFGNETGNE